MKTLALAVVVIAGSAICAHAQQAPTTAFDGTYEGVSTTTNRGFNACVGGSRPRRPLIITNGTAVWHAGQSGDNIFQGAVTSKDGFAMRNQRADYMVTKIDDTGKITGEIDIGNTGHCIMTFVWQKKN